MAERPLLTEALPELAAALVRGLEELGRPELVRQVAALRLHAGCACTNESCASFYTVLPMRRWFRRGDEVVLPQPEGSLALDVTGGEIVYVEALEMPGLRQAVQAALAG